MNATTIALNKLFDRIPRRYTPENVKEIYALLAEYEDVLTTIEAENNWYEKNTPSFFDHIDSIRQTIKKSTDNKASKKTKDLFFDEASGALKDSVQSLVEVYADGTKK